MKKILFSFLLAALALACHKETKSTAADYLVVGYSNQAWGPNCEAYKITSEAVFADSTACAFHFRTTPLPDDKYQTAKVLLEEIPVQLLDEQQTNFPCEQCADTGGYIIEFQKDGQTYHFTVDEQATDVPDYLKSFTGKIQVLLNDL